MNDHFYPDLQNMKNWILSKLLHQFSQNLDSNKKQEINL